MSGVVYCLTNQAMPGYVKIGKTTNLSTRLRTLDNTSSPLPFDCVYAIEVDDHDDAERLLHETFGHARTRSTREFFEISEQHVIAAMRLTGGRDITPGRDVVEDEESQRALDKARERRAAFNFEMVGLKPGDEIYFRGSPNVSGAEASEQFVKVVSKNKILFREKETSLSAAALVLLREEGWSLPAGAVGGPAYWYYGGESMWERRLRMEQAD